MFLGQVTESEQAASRDDFSYGNYVAYVLYPPLYIAGPIITFSSFIQQVSKSECVNCVPPKPSRSSYTVLTWVELRQIKQQSQISRKAISAYAVRFAVCWLTMEVILHYMYVVAIKDSYAIYRHGGVETRSPAWKGDTPFELAMISFWNLVIMWLKVRLHTPCSRDYGV